MMQSRNYWTLLAQRSGWQLRWAILCTMLLMLSACALPRFSAPEELPEGVDSHQSIFTKTLTGGRTTSRVISMGTRNGAICGSPKRVDIKPGIRANIYPYRSKCEPLQGFTPDEEKLLNGCLKVFANAVDVSPTLTRFFSDLGPIDFDWYLIEYGVRTEIELESDASDKIPRLALSMKLLSKDASKESNQIDAVNGFASVVHEYFHALQRSRASKRSSFAAHQLLTGIEETVAYLMSDAVAIELGLSQFFRPNDYLDATPLSDAWEGAGRASVGSVQTSVAGMRLSYVMLKNAEKCPDRQKAIRGMISIVYDQLADANSMTIADLQNIDALSCKAKEAKGEPLAATFIIPRKPE